MTTQNLSRVENRINGLKKGIFLAMSAVYIIPTVNRWVKQNGVRYDKSYDKYLEGFSIGATIGGFGFGLEGFGYYSALGNDNWWVFGIPLVTNLGSLIYEKCYSGDLEEKIT